MAGFPVIGSGKFIASDILLLMQGVQVLNHSERSEGLGPVVLSNAKDLVLKPSEPTRSFGRMKQALRMTGPGVVLSNAKDLVLRPSEPTRSFGRWNSPQDDTPSVVLNEVKDLV